MADWTVESIARDVVAQFASAGVQAQALDGAVRVGGVDFELFTRLCHHRSGELCLYVDDRRVQRPNSATASQRIASMILQELPRRLSEQEAERAERSRREREKRVEKVVQRVAIAYVFENHITIQTSLDKSLKLFAVLAVLKEGKVDQRTAAMCAGVVQGTASLGQLLDYLSDNGAGELHDVIAKAMRE